MKVSRYVFKGALILALLLLSACGLKAGTGSILLGGDVILSRGGVALFGVGVDEYQPWGMLQKYQEKNQDALLMVNLESPLGTLPTGLDGDQLEMNLCADPSEIRVLLEGGIDLVTRANNHTQDCQAGEESSKSQLFEQKGIEEVTAGDPLQLVEWQGMTVAVLALDDVSSQ